MQKYIYVILTRTTTKIGKIIRLVTHYEYNHVSISLDENLTEVYSFARYYKNAPLVGGFVVESIMRYDSDKTKLKVFKIPVDLKTYMSIKRYINLMKIYKNKFLYNSISAFFFIFRIRVNIKDSYTCIEFAEHLLTKFNVLNLTSKNFKTIKALDKSLSDYTHFEGKFNELDVKHDWGIDNYINKQNICVIFFSSICHFTKLVYRFII